MSKSSNIRRIAGLLFVFAACVAFACADLVVSSASGLPQNTNSSTTQDDESTRGGMMTTNSSTPESTTPRRRRRRRPRRTPRPAAVDTNSADTNSAAPTEVSTPEAAPMPSMRQSSGSTRETAADPAEKADLSGTYAGTVNYPEGGMMGAATLTITGEDFTVTPDGGGAPVSGKITAVMTRGYTGATMMFGARERVSPSTAPPPLPAVSVRAKKMGDSLWLKSVKGEKREFSFTSAKPARGKRRVHRM